MFTPVAILEMLARLHERGYQRLRLSSGISPTGLNWRYGVAPADHFEKDGYRLRGGHYPGTAFGTTRGDDPPFGWDDARGLGPDQLAALFLERFPEVAAAGSGSDAGYVEWLARTLEACQPDGAPVMYGEYVDVAADGYIAVADGKCVPLPPGLPGTTDETAR